MLYASGANTLAKRAIGTTGQVLQVSGGVPTWAATSTLGLGTVTSVGMTVPTGLSVSGSPITTSGTFAVSLAGGYVIPLTASTTEWSTAYGWGNHASAGYLSSASIDTSAELAAIVTNETGSGALVFGTSPTFTTNANFFGDTISDFTGAGLTLSSGVLTVSTSTVRNYISATYPILYDNSTGIISAQYADGVEDGVLSATDWNTFNGKLSSVGVGTTINSAGDWSILFTNTDNSLTTDSGNFIFNKSSGRFGVGTSTLSATLNLQASSTENPLVIYSNTGSTLFNVTNSGLVGISSTTPGYNLSVVGTSRFTGASIFDSTLNVAGAAVLSSTLNVTGQTTVGNASSTNFTVSTNAYLGTVRSGTWNGSAISEIYGGTNQTSYTTGDMLYASGANTLAKRAIGTTGQVLMVSGGVPTWTATSSLGFSGSGTVNSGTLGQVAFYGANGTAVSGTSTLFFANGNIGVGTTTPAQKLDVYGSINIASNYGLYYNNEQILRASTTLNNFFLGKTSGNDTMTGTGNVFMGTNGGQSLTSGGLNAALGHLAGAGLTTGGSNVLLGASAGTNLTTGGFNVVIGQNAGTLTATSSNSVLIGYTAGRGVTGSDNTFIGTYAGYTLFGTASDVTNSVAIGNMAQVTASNSIVLGDATNASLKVGIGTTSPAARLSVTGSSGINPLIIASSTGTQLFTINQSGAALFGNSAGTSGQILRSFGSTALPQWVATSTLGFASAALTTSLTNGYLSRWTGSAFSNSVIRDNGTVAGVNATSSSYNFNIQGTAGVNPFNVASSTGTSLLTVLQNGNVGIGTNAPNALLDVVGNFFLGESTGSNSFGYKNSEFWFGAVNSGSGFKISTSAGFGSGVVGYINSNNGAAGFSSFNVTGQTTLANASSTNFTVSTNSYLGTVRSGTWNGTAIGPTFGGTNQTSYTTGDMLYASGANTLAKRAIGTTGQVLMVSGGVPTWTATSTLGFASAALTTSLTNGYLSRWTGTAFSNSVIRDNGTVAGVNATSSSFSFNVQGSAGVNPFNVASSTGTSLFTILQSGNVGINKISPTYKLDIEGEVRFTNSGGLDYSFGSNGFDWGSLMSLNRTADTVKIGDWEEASDTLLTVDKTNNIITLMNGAVGVGTTTPVGSFAVQGFDTGGGSNATATPAFAVYGSQASMYLGHGQGIILKSGDGYDSDGGSGSNAGNISLIGGRGGSFFASGNDGAGGSIYLAGGVSGTTGFARGNVIIGMTENNVSMPTRLGIGTSSPIATFSLKGIGGISPLIVASSSNTRLFEINQAGAALFGNNAGTSGYVLQSFGANAVPQWVATSSLGISGGGSSQWTTSGSNIYYSTGNVGIGTATPMARLTVTGTSTSPTATLFDVASSTNASLFRITSAGNVGIGTTSPAGKLGIYTYENDKTVYGVRTDVHSIGNFETYVHSAYGGYFKATAISGNAAYGVYAESLGSDTNIDYGVYAKSSNGTGVFGLGYTGVHASTTIPGGYAFYGQGKSYFSGNIGIASTTPAASLTITGTVGSNAMMVSSSTGATLFSVTQNGNVGVGTSSPVAKLTVTGSTGFNPFVVASSTGAQLFNVQQNGNVGIGVTNPTAKFTLSNNVATGFLDNYSEFQQLLYDGGAAALSYGLGIKANNMVFNSGGAGGGFSFDANSNSTRFVIDGTGNVGVGTSTPIEKLSVSGDILFTNTRTRTMTRTLPTTVGNAVDIGSFLFTNGAANLEVWITVPSNGYAQSKRYLIPAKYAGTSNTWQTVQAISSTGAYTATQNVDLEINSNNATTSLRLRRTLGTTAGVAYITILQQGVEGDTFTASTASASVSAPTAIYEVFADALLASRFQALSTPTDLGSYSLTNWGSTGQPVTAFFKAPTVSGAGGGATIYPTEPALILGRNGINSTTYPNFAEFKIGRYENSGASSRTQLDIALTHGNGDATGTPIMSLRSNGNVGIGTTSPQRKLHVYTTADEAPVRFEDANGYCEINPTSTSWTCTSDANLKKDIMTLASTDMAEKVMALNPVTFRWKNQTADDLRYGLIAQEVEEIFPEFVHTDERGNKSVSYGSFTPVLISTVQELNARVESLEVTLAAAQAGTSSSIGEWIGNQISAVIGSFKKIKIEEGMEIKDQKTGEVYCVTISDGEWLKTKGECGFEPTGGGGDEPVDPPTDPVDPPADPIDPPADPVDPPADPEPTEETNDSGNEEAPEASNSNDSSGDEGGDSSGGDSSESGSDTGSEAGE
jgi:hypothetical protein